MRRAVSLQILILGGSCACVSTGPEGVLADAGRADAAGASDGARPMDAASVDGGSPVDATPATDVGILADASPAADAAPAVDAALGMDASPPSDGGAGGAALRGTVRFVESFEDTSFDQRGWYDGPRGTLSASEARVGLRSFECRFRQGTTGCEGGTPGRHLFTGSEAVYLSYWVKYSANWVGSQRSYHPHEFHFVTDADTIYVGPAATHLTTYIEDVGGTPRLALQDSLNVDTACILRNDDSFAGCNGDFSTFVFTEARSVCACNGLLGDLDGRDCFSTGANSWYSARFWDAPRRVFDDQPGPSNKNEWHFVEAYFRLNTVQGGIGQVDGRLRYYVDGELLISSDRVLMRTGQHPAMLFNQFLVAPYIGDGSPVDQQMWIDELTVAEGN